MCTGLGPGGTQGDLGPGSERRPAWGGRDTDGAPVGPLRLPLPGLMLSPLARAVGQKSGAWSPGPCRQPLQGH